MEAKKLYEFTGFVKHSVCIAADNEESAREAFVALGDNWPITGDEIGPDNAKDVDLLDIRDIDGGVYEDVAHVVV